MCEAFIISHRLQGWESTNTQQTNALFFCSTQSDSALQSLWRKSFSRPSPRCGSRSACVSSVKSPCWRRKSSASESIPRVIHLLLCKRQMSGNWKKVNTLHSEADASWDACCLPLHCLNHPETVPSPRHPDQREHNEITILAVTFCCDFQRDI